MSAEFLIVLKQMTIFAIFLAVGFGGAKLHYLTDSVLSGLSVFVVKIALPFVVLSALPYVTTKEVLFSVLPFLVCGLFAYGLAFIFGIVTARAVGLKGNRRNIHIVENGCSNLIFMGLPLITALVGAKGIFYVLLYNILDALVLWTIGIYLCAPVGSGGWRADFKKNIKKVINPSTVALCLSFLMIFFNWKPVEGGTLQSTLTVIGDTCRPLSMIYIGGTLANRPMKVIKKHKSAFLILLKMILAPLIMYFFVTALGIFNHEAVMTLSLIVAMPSMVVVSMLAKTQGSDYQYASSCIFLTTLCSLFTIPLVIYLIGCM